MSEPYVGEVILVRHGQASFGADDYDKLSALGHEQARALGAALAKVGTEPARWFSGTLRRQKETLKGVADAFPTAEPSQHPGLDEFDGEALLRAYGGADTFRAALGDRKAFFRALREAVLAWQRGELAVAEPFAAFKARVDSARAALFRPRATVVAVSSGGPIALMVADTLRAPPEAMVTLQMQIKNASVTRIRFGASGASLASFNETPHIADAATQRFLTYA